MAGGQQIDVGQGTILGGPSQPISGSEAASATGNQAAAQFVRLQSRKVGGGTATFQLSGQATALAQGAIIGGPGQVLVGSAASAVQGSVAKARAVAPVGSSITSVGGAMTAGGGSINNDWAVRSLGAFNANRMDTQAARDAMVFLNINGSAVNVTYDPNVKSAGNNGSIKIAVLSAAGTDDGAFRFPMGRNFLPGDQFCLSYRVWATEQWVYQPWATGFECGPKTLIIDDFNETSSADEIVPGMTDNMDEFGGYNQDGTGSFVTVEDPNFNTACAGGPFDFRLQPSIDRGANTLTGTNPDTGAAWTACEQDRRRYGRLYQARNNAPNVRPGLGDPFGGGVKMKARTWYTRTMLIRIGTPGVANSTWRELIAEDGQPYTELWNKTDRKFGTPVANGVNTGWFMTYVTGRSPGGRKITSTSGSIPGITVPTCGIGTEMGACTLRYDASTQRFSFRTPNDGFGTPRGFSVANNILLLNVCSASDRTFTQTAFASSFQLPQAVIPVSSTTGFPSAGTIVIGDPQGGAGGVGEERVQYTGKTATSFTGCSGGTGFHPNGVESVNCASYVVVRIDNPALLPSSGITDMTITVADGRPDTEFHYADIICAPELVPAPGVTPNALATLAASMGSGTWAQLNTSNLTTTPITSTSGMWFMNTADGLGGIGGDSNNMAWDPVHKRIHFVGQHHGNIGVGMRHVMYDAPTNNWTTIAHFGPLGDDTGHGQNSICCDRFTGDVYFARYDNAPLAKYTHATGTWDINFKAMPDITNLDPGVVFWSGPLTGVTGGRGAVVCHDADFGRCWVLDIGTGSWTVTQTFPDQSPGRGEVAAYNARGNVGMFGGGENPSQIPMVLNSSKQLTILPSIAPNALSIRDGTLCEHPTQADAFLSIARDGHLWKFTAAGVYTDLGPLPAQVNVPPQGGPNNVCVVAIPEYGVMVAVSTDSVSSANFSVYKA